MVTITAADTALSADNLKHQTVPEDVVSSVVPADFPPHLDADARKSLRPISDTGLQTMESEVFPSTGSPAPLPRPPPPTPDVVDINGAEVPMQPLPVPVASQLSQLPNDGAGAPTLLESALLENSPLENVQIEGAMQLHQAFGPEEPELASAADTHADVDAVSASQDHGVEHLVPGFIEHLSEGAIRGTTRMDEVAASEVNAHYLALPDTAYDNAPADADVWDEFDEELFGAV